MVFLMWGAGLWSASAQVVNLPPAVYYGGARNSLWQLYSAASSARVYAYDAARSNLLASCTTGNADSNEVNYALSIPLVSAESSSTALLPGMRRLSISMTAFLSAIS